MRRPRVVRRLRGQLVCVVPDADGVTVDGLLAARDGATVLVTLSFGVARRSLPAVLDVLRGWERRGAAVDVVIGDGPRGQQVELSSAGGRMVLSARQ